MDQIKRWRDGIGDNTMRRHILMYDLGLPIELAELILYRAVLGVDLYDFSCDRNIWGSQFYFHK